ncbi:MAG: DNA polymerase III subunit gamma/tau [Candidatus Midichloria mitochondrii]|nr:DNA polymerase III subunit gamma/tau [Candidatus Midichloria mitochondrii]MDJ1287764.1 DNA polymerase III subunit gamma/tau [Candidatus Midichloria mitochondrii]MDJ1298732.1 DNA polymerase III subunit gamma/tau [Candidatus Midichloria mitochondrii]MDJ1312614.1 DNA polymerase III subunit gamma/tau [Candidatus Midichloria mitochondrii]MDJ1583222.1 DNA polymerase III subunit gamma/tau [Candidatus Midichloria mitochondrii]
MQDSLFIQEELNKNKSYKVLARKYRPKSFNELIGQDILVKTLTNAIKMNRFPHAILLTGIRGTGKTTTARIITKIMNCQSIDLQNESLSPCERCDSCVSIASSQHTDILEMDAASHTSVNDVRVIIENAYYAPVSSRFRAYIIDEVHMLSTSAFNALLKTLEEPPQHLIFIFATTEIQKIPLTILSRCQRFDLRRVSTEVLKSHYLNILKQENISIENEAIDLIVKAADGSVRDGLSILDQAIALSHGTIKGELIRDMLCINNKVQIIELFMYLIAGDVEELLNLVANLYNSGGDPVMIANQLLELVYEISKFKTLGDANYITGFSQSQLEKIQLLQISFLARSWQMLLKGLEEVKTSIMPLQALEMVLIRLCYLNASITPEEILSKLENSKLDDDKPSESKPAPVQDTGPSPKVNDVDNLLTILYEKNELDLYYMLHNEVAIVEFEEGMMKINPLNYSPHGLVNMLKKKLKETTKIEWHIELVKDKALTVGLQNKQQQKEKKEAIASNDMVKEVLNHFTGSKIIDIKVR